MQIRNQMILSPLWRRLGVFVVVMFLLYLGDGMIADFVPGFMQEILGSPLLMGIVMSSSSVAGLLLDLLFAKILPKASPRQMLVLACLTAMLMVCLLLLATVWPFVLVLIMAMISWGIFYEFFGFASQKYVVAIADRSHRAAIWGIIETFRSLAYGIGPLALGFLMNFGVRVALGGIGLVYLVGILVIFVLRLEQRTEIEVQHDKITVWHEIGHWRALIVHIWPMIILGILLGFVDAVFWTTGTVVNDMLAREHVLGGFFMTTYMISSAFVGVILGGKEIKQGKKKLAEILVLLSGVALLFMTAIPVWWWYLLVVFVSTLLSAVAWPLVDSVYTDLLSRMGREQIHMIGLRSASHSVSYIIGPIIAGLLAQTVGELSSFAYLGWIVIATSLFLLAVTPKKLKLPQNEIRTWE